MCHSGDTEDTGQFNRQEILRIRKMRQTNRGHPVYGTVATVLGFATIAVWAFLLRDIHVDIEELPTRRDLAYLGLAVGFVIAASVATATWMLARNARALAADIEILADDRQQKLLAATAATMKQVLEEFTREDRKRQFNRRFGDMFAAEGTTGGGAPAGQADDRTQVIRLGDRTRRSNN